MALYSCSDDSIPIQEQVNDGPAASVIDVPVTSQADLSVLASRVYNCKNSVLQRRALPAGMGLLEAMPPVPAVPSDAQPLSKVQPWAVAAGNYVVEEGETLAGNYSMGGVRIYVKGTLNLQGFWNANNETAVYVLPGGTLNFSGGEDVTLGTPITYYNYGTFTTTSNVLYVGYNGAFCQNGDLELADKTLKVQGRLFVGGDVKVNKLEPISGARMHVAGDVQVQQPVSLDGVCAVDGKFVAPSLQIINAGRFYAGCSVLLSDGFSLNGYGAEAHLSYLEADHIDQCAGSHIFLSHGSMIRCAHDYINLNNGQSSVTLLGDNADAVIKTGGMGWNISGGATAVHIFNTPGSASRIVVECGRYFHAVQNGQEFNPEDVDFERANVIQVADETFSPVILPGCECNQLGYNAKDEPEDKTLVLDLISDVDYDNHTHENISATCVYPYNGRVYVSYHVRGASQGGCVEVMQTTDNQTALLQYVADAEGVLDYNHLMVDAADARLYVVGNSSKKGAIMAYMQLDEAGLLRTAPEVVDGREQQPLRLITLQAAAGGDGNCVVRSGNQLLVASTTGIESYQAGTLSYTGMVPTAGKAKHIAVAGDRMAVLALTGTAESGDTPMPLAVSVYGASDVTLSAPWNTYDAGMVQPSDGKNVVALDGNDVYVCLGQNGFRCMGASNWSFVAESQAKGVKGSCNGSCNGCAFDERYIYLAYGNLGLIVLDKATGKEVARRACTKSANYVCLDNGYIYVAYGQDRLQVFRLMER